MVQRSQSAPGQSDGRQRDHTNRDYDTNGHGYSHSHGFNDAYAYADSHRNDSNGNCNCDSDSYFYGHTDNTTAYAHAVCDAYGDFHRNHGNSNPNGESYHYGDSDDSSTDAHTFCDAHVDPTSCEHIKPNVYAYTHFIVYVYANPYTHSRCAESGPYSNGNAYAHADGFSSGHPDDDTDSNRNGDRHADGCTNRRHTHHNADRYAHADPGTTDGTRDIDTVAVWHGPRDADNAAGTFIHTNHHTHPDTDRPSFHADTATLGPSV